jgi:hypothetical protein
MNRIIIAGLIAAGLLLVAVRYAMSGDGEGLLQRFGIESEGVAVAPATDPLYRKECGACHFAYQPGWLPAASWKAIMGDLANHFGDNAELAPEAVASIEAYLVAHAADADPDGRSVAVMRSLIGRTPPRRITEVPYIARKHRELPTKLVTDNPKVRSLSQCNACHTRADSGSFNEGSVVIPGFGRWDD